ncbi:MAG: PaaI family thioesterase [Candidatus Brocadiae bacterium]|nr:PaaI family thioesterase [Candidatus Brocadiia bacterium]
MRLLANYPACFICGNENPTGLHACYYREEDKVVAFCEFKEHHAGYKGIVHGGLISALLDEALGRIIASLTQKMVFTGSLNMRFHRPLPTGTLVMVEAIMDKEQRHPKLYWQASGKLFSKDTGELYAQAQGRFFKIQEEKYAEILSSLLIEGCPRSITMEDL